MVLLAKPQTVPEYSVSAAVAVAETVNKATAPMDNSFII